MRLERFKVYLRLVWLSKHPDATAAELAAAKDFHISVKAANQFLDSQTRRGLVERRVVYKISDKVRL